MQRSYLETRFKTLDAIGEAYKKGRVGFTEASNLRDLTRAGLIKEVEERLAPMKNKR